MAQDTSASRTIDSARDPGSSEQDSAAHSPRAGTTVRRVPLTRLLSVVVLSPAQALLVAAKLLDAAHPSGSTNGTNPADHRFLVALTPSGEVGVARAAAGEGTPVIGLLAELAENARRLPAHPPPEQVLLLRRLEAAATDPRPEPGARARELETALDEALGPGAQLRLSGQLAALVGAFAHVAASVAAPDDAHAAAAVSRPGPRRSAPSGPGPGRSSRRGRVTGYRRARTRRLVLVVLMLTAAIAAIGYVLLRNPDAGSPGTLDRNVGQAEPTAPAESSGQSARQQPPGSRPQVTSLAGRSSGPVTAVAMVGSAGCTPGTPCPVTVTVRFRPSMTTQPVVWRVGSARSCVSPVTWSDPVTVTAQPGWTSVYATSSVLVSEGRSPVLVALTTAPARAQSPPAPVAGSSLRC